MNNYYQPYYGAGNQGGNLNQISYYIEKANYERKQIRALGNILGITITIYIACQIISSFVLYYGPFYEAYENSAAFQSCFNTLGVEVFALVLPFGIMALINKKKYKSALIPSAKLPFGRICLWVGFGMICCVGADYIVALLITVFEILGHPLVEYDMPSPDSLFACIASIIGTAVVPAVCEEFAMRCCSLGLLKNYGKAFGVVAVSFVFGLLHGNVIQFVFAGIVGLILGYVTIKTDSVIPAVLIHGFNNGMSVTGELFEYASGKAASEKSTYVCMIFWLCAGIISIIVLAIKGQFKRAPEPPREPYSNSLGKKLCSFFFVPGMIVPFIYLIYATVVSIE